MKRENELMISSTVDLRNIVIIKQDTLFVRGKPAREIIVGLNISRDMREKKENKNQSPPSPRFAMKCFSIPRGFPKFGHIC